MLRSPILSIVMLAALATATDAGAQRAPAKAAAAAAAGEMIAQPCFSCHGPMGASAAGPMPIIGGQQEVYLVDVLQAFRSGDRPSTVMGRLMKGYSDAEIQAMSRYIAGLPFVMAAQSPDPARAERGRAGYSRTCKKCHLDNGRDASEGEYPRLAGQWLDYMLAMMTEIRAGTRKVDDKFRDSIERLSRDELDDVLYFFASQKQGAR